MQSQSSTLISPPIAELSTGAAHFQPSVSDDPFAIRGLREMSAVSHSWTLAKLASALFGLAGSVTLFRLASQLGGWWWCLAGVAFFVSVWVQHVMAEEIHDGVHFRLAANHRANDALSGFYSCMIGIAFSNYRAAHLAHHRHFGSTEDPDYSKYSVCPRGIGQWFLYFAFNFSGVDALYRTLFGGRNQHQAARPSRQHPLGTFGGQLGLWAVSLPFAGPYWYPVCYAFALITVSYGITQFRTMLEHCDFSTPSGRLFNFPGLIGKHFFGAQFGYNYHGTHHLHPTVTNYRLGLFTQLNQESLTKSGIESVEFTTQATALILSSSAPMKKPNEVLDPHLVIGGAAPSGNLRCYWRRPPLKKPSEESQKLSAE
jgi:fatty acid desaturase